MYMALGRDRRQHPRSDNFGKAFVILDEVAVPYRLDNLSAGGALLGDGPPLPADRRLRVVLRVPALPGIELEARLVWCSDEEQCLYGIEFVSMDADVEDAIQDAVVAVLSGEPLPRMASHRPKLASWLP